MTIEALERVQSFLAHHHGDGLVLVNQPGSPLWKSDLEELVAALVARRRGW